MYFLAQAIKGIQRRWLTFSFCLVATVILLISAASIGLWSYWLRWDPSQPVAKRSASILLETQTDQEVDRILEQILFLPGVYSARTIAVEEFRTYLRENFPDFSANIVALGESIIPKMIELTFDKKSDRGLRVESLDRIRMIPGVKNIDIGEQFIAGAMKPINWLSWAGIILTVGLWFVLMLVAIGHYQGVLQKEWDEIQLIRSFGASRYWVMLPWMVEACIHTLVGSLFAILTIYVGKNYLTELFNRFFNILGYEPFALSHIVIVTLGVSLFVMGFLAHSLGGFIALLRGKIV